MEITNHTTKPNNNNPSNATQPTALPKIPCCLCGTLIYSNAANQCGACLAQQFDVKALLQRGPNGGDLLVHQCRQCRAFEINDTGRYEQMDMESPALLTNCLKRIPALQKTGTSGGSAAQGGGDVSNIHLMDVSWVWTEPHSMRLKLRLTVRAEVCNNAVSIQQRVVVVFMVRFKQCSDCNREFSNRTWQAIVQVRQKRDEDAKGLIAIETALSKNKAARKDVIQFTPTKNGFDFYFLGLPQAQSFSSYLSRFVAMRVKITKKLVSSDNHSNTANIKSTVVCDMVPLCTKDLVICDKRMRGKVNSAGGGLGKLNGRLCLVTKVTGVVHFVDAAPKRGNIIKDCMAELHPESYWKAGGEKCYPIVLSSKRLVKFIVLDVELCDASHSWETNTNDTNDHDTSASNIYAGPQSGVEKYALADVEVVRESDFGNNDETFQCVTHLGNLLQVGDVVLGYDIACAVLPGASDDDNYSQCFNSSFEMPDVVLVKKLQGVSSTTEDDIPTNETRKTEIKKLKVKSSASKRRERRAQKAGKKMEALEKQASKMGFVDEGAQRRPTHIPHEHAAFEEELKNDSRLADELILAEENMK